MTKSKLGKNKKFFDKLLASGFTSPLVNKYDAKGEFLRSDITNTIARLIRCKGRAGFDGINIPNDKFRLKASETFRDMSEEDKNIIIEELIAYLKPSIVSYDVANKNIIQSILDDGEYNVRYKCDGVEYRNCNNESERMYQNSESELYTQRRKARKILESALKKILDGKSGEELYDILIYKIAGCNVEAKELKYIGKRTSEVVSSSFSTYHDYEYEVKFPFETVVVPYTSVSYFSGGW